MTNIRRMTNILSFYQIRVDRRYPLTVDKRAIAFFNAKCMGNMPIFLKFEVTFSSLRSAEIAYRGLRFFKIFSGSMPPDPLVGSCRRHDIKDTGHPVFRFWLKECNVAAGEVVDLGLWRPSQFPSVRVFFFFAKEAPPCDCLCLL